MMKRNTKDMIQVKLRKGDRVSIPTKTFGDEYAKGKEHKSYGVAKSIRGKMVNVLWEGSDKTWKSHISHLTKLASESVEQLTSVMLDAKIEELEKKIQIKEWLNEWSRGKTRIETILLIMEIHSQLQGAVSDEPGSWPEEFLQAMISKDWREWVMAVKAEIESWNLFDAAEEVTYHSMERGVTLIPLGELFSRKRNGKFKFRQIAMGNMLKPGRDYGETFSTTISGDGLRWFFSLASTCGKKVYGWDATTGYLQAEQRVHSMRTSRLTTVCRTCRSKRSERSGYT
jgi:hypothetical protein